VLGIADQGHVIPLVANSDLGNSTFRWRSFFATGMVQAGTLAPNGAAGTVRGVQWQTNSQLRFYAFLDTSGESAGNVGSNFLIARYSDAGGFLGTSLLINRASGNITLASDGGAVLIGNTDVAVTGAERFRAAGDVMIQSNSARALAVRAITGATDVLRVDGPAGAIFGYRLSLGGTGLWGGGFFEVNSVVGSEGVFIGTPSAPGGGLAVRKAVSIGLVSGADVTGSETLRVADTVAIRGTGSPILKFDGGAASTPGVEFYNAGVLKGSIYAYQAGDLMLFRYGTGAALSGFHWQVGDGSRDLARLRAQPVAGNANRAVLTLLGDLEFINPTTYATAGAVAGYIQATVNGTLYKIPLQAA
jgi:hypothetical protein